MLGQCFFFRAQLPSCVQVFRLSCWKDNFTPELHPVCPDGPYHAQWANNIAPIKSGGSNEELHALTSIQAPIWGPCWAACRPIWDNPHAIGMTSHDSSKSHRSPEARQGRQAFGLEVQVFLAGMENFGLLHSGGGDRRTFILFSGHFHEHIREIFGFQFLIRVDPISQTSIIRWIESSAQNLC